jgi:hypothetical protein
VLTIGVALLLGKPFHAAPFYWLARTGIANVKVNGGFSRYITAAAGAGTVAWRIGLKTVSLNIAAARSRAGLKKGSNHGR